MKIYLQLLVYLSYSFLGLAQKAPKVKNYTETIVKNEDIIELINVLKETVKIKTDDKCMYYSYQSHQIYHTKGGYKGKLLNGPYQKENKEGKLLAQGAFKKGLKTGLWKYWDDKGELVRTENWNGGFKDGTWTWYEGTNKREEEYKKGERVEEKQRKEAKTKEEKQEKTDKQVKEEAAEKIEEQPLENPNPQEK